MSQRERIAALRVRAGVRSLCLAAASVLTTGTASAEDLERLRQASPAYYAPYMVLLVVDAADIPAPPARLGPELPLWLQSALGPASPMTSDEEPPERPANAPGVLDGDSVNADGDSSTAAAESTEATVLEPDAALAKTDEEPPAPSETDAEPVDPIAVAGAEAPAPTDGASSPPESNEEPSQEPSPAAAIIAPASPALLALHTGLRTPIVPPTLDQLVSHLQLSGLIEDLITRQAEQSLPEGHSESGPAGRLIIDPHPHQAQDEVVLELSGDAVFQLLSFWSALLDAPQLAYLNQIAQVNYGRELDFETEGATQGRRDDDAGPAPSPAPAAIARAEPEPAGPRIYGDEAAASLTLVWSAPDRGADGMSLAARVDHYRILAAQSREGALQQFMQVPAEYTGVHLQLEPGSWFLGVSAVTLDGAESPVSEEIERVVP